MQCPFCGKEMTRMNASATDYSVLEQPRQLEDVYYCQVHGVMNKPSDLREKVDQIAKRV